MFQLPSPPAHQPPTSAKHNPKPGGKGVHEWLSVGQPSVAWSGGRADLDCQ